MIEPTARPQPRRSRPRGKRRALALALAVALMTPVTLGSLVTLAPPAAASEPVHVPLAAGQQHSCALTPDGGVKCWGPNFDGELGDGTQDKSGTPVDVSGLDSGVVAVAAGFEHSCALTLSGGAKCWGLNNNWELGDGTTVIRRLVPVDVSGLSSGVAAIAAGGFHSCALTTSGGVKCWGANYHGELGNGTTTNSNTPVDVVGLTSGVAAIGTGFETSCAVTTSGGLKCWGQNDQGQLGNGTTTDGLTPVDVTGLTSGVAAVAPARFHSCAVTTTGGLKCWGANFSGFLGDGTTSGSLTPVDVSGLTSGVSAVATGEQHSCALLGTGTVKCWGSNDFGQLGDSTNTNRSTPVDVSGLSSGVIAIASGGEHSCALLGTGTVKCWGDNEFGELGDGVPRMRTAPVAVSGLTSGVATVAAGENDSCAVTSAGAVDCWGRNQTGQLGDGTTTDRLTPVTVTGFTSGGVAIASDGDANGEHTCVLTTVAGVKCWGKSDGGLGDGTTNPSLTPVDVSGLTSGVAAIGTGRRHSCALTTSAGVKCWGSNDVGQLGDGTTAPELTPVDVTGLTSGVAAIAVGDLDTCALTTSGGMKCWGWNTFGQLGDGTTTNRLTPVDVTGLSSGVTAIAAGDGHSCAVTTTGGVKCWGWNSEGQLGDGTQTDRLTPVDVSGLTSGAASIAAGSEHTCAVTTTGGLKCWGQNIYGQLGDGANIRQTAPEDVPGLTTGVAAVATGLHHSCALTTAGGVDCWGDNLYGQMGDGTAGHRSTPVDAVGSFWSGQPSAPTSVVGSPLDGSASVSWLTPVDGGTSAISDYRVSVFSSSGGAATGVTGASSRLVGSATTAYTFNGLTNGTAYTFKVAAVNAAGTGAQSALSAAATPRTVPGAPTAVAGTPGDTQVALTWTAPANNGGATITDYSVSVYDGSGGAAPGVTGPTTRPVGSATTAYTFNGLTNGTAYTFKVAAVNAAGTGAQSALSAAVTPRTVPGAPTAVAGTPGDTQVALTWTAPAGDGGSAITDYSVSVFNSSGGAATGVTGPTTRPVGSTTTAYTFNGLTNGTAYRFKVAAVNAVGTGPASSLSGAVTPRSVPGAPTAVEGTPGNSQVALTWTAPTDNGGATITNYSVSVFNNSGGAATGVTGPTTRLVGSATAAYTFTGLTNGTAYTFKVAAVNAAGTGAQSALSAAVTPRTVPDAPSGSGGTAGNSQVALTWTAPAGDGGSAITDYAVSVYNASGGGATDVTGATTRLVGSTTTAYTFTGLTNGTAYTFKVAAVNAAGAGAQSAPSAALNPATFTVPALISDPGTAGYDTGFTVDNSVTLTATGSWCDGPSSCFGPGGDTPPNPGGSGYLEPTATKGALVGRLGSSGPWTEIGSGPQTLNGTGELLLALNDQTGSYSDNAGTLQVDLAANLHLHTSYTSVPEVLAGSPLGWEGQVTSSGDATLTNLTLFASAAQGLATASTDVPTWHFTGSGSPKPCAILTPGGSSYFCTVPSLAPGQSVVVDADVFTQGLAPQPLTDLLAVGISDQTGGCFGFCPEHVPVAPSASDVIDGLQFNVTAPSTVNAGDLLTISETAMNTSSAVPYAINGITTFASIDRGQVASSTTCAFENNTPIGTGSTARCPATATFDLAAGATSAATSLDIDTTGLAGTTIHYTTYATSPDLGGSSQVVTRSVFVTAPAGGVVISTPGNNATLGQSLPNDFTAVPSASTGNNVTSVDLQVDGVTVASPSVPPYTTTLPPDTLTSGPHTLTAIMHQDGGGADAQTSITVQVAAAPTVGIVAPAGFAPGGSLDTAKTFTATVTRGAPATITSVVWQVDGSITVPSAAAAPYTATVNPATLVLTNGAHTLSAAATDSVGQTTTSTFSFTVPVAALNIPPVTRLANSITPGGDAAWTVQVNNSSGVVAHHVTLTLNATVTDSTSATAALTFDTLAINGSLHLPPTTPTCRPGVGTSLICTLPDIPAASAVQFPVFVLTDSLTDDSTITGDAVASAANAAATSPQPLGAVDVTTCGDACVVGVAAAGTSFGSNSDNTAPTEQTVVLSSGLTSTAGTVTFGHTFRLGSAGTVRYGRVTAQPRLDLNPAIKITLNSIDPLTSTDPVVQSACPSATPCQGQVSEVSGTFSPFTNKADPIVVVIIGRWGSTTPTGRIWMQKPAGTNGVIPPPIQLPACVVNATTREFNTPCALPQVLKSLTVNGVTTKTTYNTVLFTGNDPFFVRR